MANLAPPSSQKSAERPISFVLDDQSGTDGGGLTSIDLVIRPEDLSRNDPSRITVQQTLGGAFADNFGPGIPTIQIAGHTGWRRVESDNADGLDRFKQLYDGVYTQWHERRRNAAEAGNDPDKVKLIFADALDDFSVVVAPMVFSLRRSKSRPLLAQYQIALTVLDEDIDSESYFQYGKGGKLGYLIRGEVSGSGLLQSLGLESITGSLGKLTDVIGGIKGAIDSAKGFIQNSLIKPLTSFVKTAVGVVGAVRGLIADGVGLVTGTIGQVVSLARTITSAGVGLFRSLAGTLGLSQSSRSFFMGGAGAFSNIFCVLNNAIDVQQYVPDYSPIYGASNCSSTAGGRPVSVYLNANPFEDVFPNSPGAPFEVSTQATSAMNTLSRIDSVLAPATQGALESSLNSINAGISLQGRNVMIAAGIVVPRLVIDGKEYF